MRMVNLCAVTRALRVNNVFMNSCTLSDFYLFAFQFYLNSFDVTNNSFNPHFFSLFRNYVIVAPKTVRPDSMYDVSVTIMSSVASDVTVDVRLTILVDSQEVTLEASHICAPGKTQHHLY